MKESRLCPEAKPYLLVVFFSLLLSLAFLPLNAWLIVCCSLELICLFFLLWFFRNPQRNFSPNDSCYISPCDAQVMSITLKVDPDLGPCQCITMFLSVFNVHVNRCPRSGLLLKQEYRPGQMLPAYKPHAAEVNERNRILVQCSDQTCYAVHQITGILARRIVSDVKPDTQLKQGQRFGMIKFGSCTELLLPMETQILVKPGDRVRGVRTVLARVNETNKEVS